MVTGAAATGLVETVGAATPATLVGATVVVTGATPLTAVGPATYPVVATGAAGPLTLACPAYLASRGPSSVVCPTTVCPNPVALTESLSLIPPLTTSV